MQGIDVDAGILLYRCRGVAVGEGTAHAAHAEHDHGVGVAALAAALPLSAALPPDPNVTDVRRLSSRPSARIKIYLNFWGAEVRYTAQWVALPAVYAASVGALCLSPVCPPPPHTAHRCHPHMRVNCADHEHDVEQCAVTCDQHSTI
jgi:hypothetical protein